jgi:hypothetical protein
MVLILTAPGPSVIRTPIEEARRIVERMTSDGTYRSAQTLRLMLCMTASVLIDTFYPVTTLMVSRTHAAAGRRHLPIARRPRLAAPP